MYNIKSQFTDGELELILRVTHLMLSRRLALPCTGAHLPLTSDDLRRIHLKLEAIFNQDPTGEASQPCGIGP
jgi:hypothetical protein